MSRSDQRTLRFALVFLWQWTALVSLWEINGQSLQLLVSAGIQSPAVSQGLILGGAALDALIGFWMLLRPSRKVYGLAMAGMVGMTLVASYLLPALWLHPLGPLSKNVPIAALLWLLMKAEK